MLGLSRGAILSVVRSGVVRPARGQRGAYRFSFPDLVLLRTARALADADIPSRRITRSLRRLREQLPQELPLSGLRILADGDSVVVQDGARRWHADTGQYLLALDAMPAARGSGGLTVDVRPAPSRPGAAPAASAALVEEDGAHARDAEDWLERGCELESTDVAGAVRAYRRALRLDARCGDAYVNLGRLMHLQGRLQQAEEIYRSGMTSAAANPLLQFNLAVLMEDLGRDEEAIAAYLQSLVHDPQLADAHYNLSLLYEKLGQPQVALRHLREYRKLT